MTLTSAPSTPSASAAPTRPHRAVVPVLATAGRYLLLSAAALLFLYPLWWALSNSIKPPQQIVTDSARFQPEGSHPAELPVDAEIGAAGHRIP